MSCSIEHNLFGHPFGLAVAEVEPFRFVVRIGFVQNLFHGPSKNESRRKKVQNRRATIKCQPDNFIGSRHVGGAHVFIIQKIIHRRAIVVDRMNMTRQKSPSIFRHAKTRLSEISTYCPDALLKTIAEIRRGAAYRLKRLPESFLAGGLGGSAD